MKSSTRTGTRFPAAAKLKPKAKPRAKAKRGPAGKDPSMGMWFDFDSIFRPRRGFEKHVIAHLHRLQQTSENIMTALSDLQDRVAAIKSSLAGIRQDITDIKNGLPASGGIDAAGVEALRTALDEVVSDAAGLDAENPGGTPPAA